MSKEPLPFASPSHTGGHIGSTMGYPIIHFQLANNKRETGTMVSLFLMAIPLGDATLPHMDKREIRGRIRAMRRQEKSHYRCKDYMKSSKWLRKHAKRPVDAESRVLITDWMYQLVELCRFRRGTVEIAMSYLDRYLATRQGRHSLADRSSYQLAAMTTLYMAIKMNEQLEMETSLLADLSRGYYTDKEIAEMELGILGALKWRLAGPTALDFVQHFVALFPKSVDPRVRTAIMDYAAYQIELAVSSTELVPRDFSSIAFAAILNAMEGIDRSLLRLKAQGAIIRAIESASKIFVENLVDIQESLSNLLIHIYPDIPGSETSSSVNWDLVSSHDSKSSDETKPMGSPVFVGAK